MLLKQHNKNNTLPSSSTTSTTVAASTTTSSNDESHSSLPSNPTKLKVDGRKNNNGSDYRVQYTYLEKHNKVEEYLEWRQQQNQLSRDQDLEKYCDQVFGEGSHKFQINIGKWMNKQWNHIVEMASEQHYKKFYKPPKNNPKNGLFQTIEFRIYKELKEKRKKQQKISRKWVQITALKEFEKEYSDSDIKPAFKVSNYWNIT